MVLLFNFWPTLSDKKIKQPFSGFTFVTVVEATGNELT